MRSRISSRRPGRWPNCRDPCSRRRQGSRGRVRRKFCGARKLSKERQSCGGIQGARGRPGGAAKERRRRRWGLKIRPFQLTIVNTLIKLQLTTTDVNGTRAICAPWKRVAWGERPRPYSDCGTLKRQYRRRDDERAAAATTRPDGADAD